MPAISVPDPWATYAVYAVFLGLCFGQWVIGRLVPPRYTRSNKRQCRSSTRYWRKPLKEHSMNSLLPIPLPAGAIDTLPAAALERPARVPTCHRCGTVATVGWQRKATDAEREQHWAALEAHMREQPNLFDASNAEYVADRNAPVTKAVHGCDDHDLSPTPADDTDEAAAAAKQAGAEARALTHDADCGGHGECQCGGEA